MPEHTGIEIQVIPIDDNGFVIWDSEKYCYKDSSYKPLPNEITTPIPTNVNWYQPRWDGIQWVEGKDHPGLPVISPDPNLPMAEMPKDGIYWITDPEKPHTMEEILDYVMNAEISVDDIILNKQYFADTRMIPILLKKIQLLARRVSDLENAGR